MLECESLAGCPFFNDRMKDMPGMTQIYKNKYCLGGNKADCARYIVKNALGKDKIPITLYPNQIDKAKTLIAQK